MTDRISLLLERIFGKRVYCPACCKRVVLHRAAGNWICCFRGSLGSSRIDYADYWHADCYTPAAAHYRYHATLWRGVAEVMTPE